MLTLFPGGFEEVERDGAVELVAYTDAAGEERIWHVFGGARSTEVEDGWEDRWRTFHRPIRIGRLWVGPPWEHPPTDALAVVIDPGRAFGTGAHPTTQLCLRLLQQLPPGPLLDVGCGSGVLAIAAAALGFAPVAAVDIDAAAADATLANARANGVTVEVAVVGADDALPASSTVVANISAAAVGSLAMRIESRTLVTSGYLQADELALEGWTHVERLTLDGWAADVYERA
ncbi:MAG TPA: 50S ribosomal protein L11 methyltransferase [Gaiellaceae bacterium]|nr:50S ribosomal protein L11 methyltransferase [Gaiellaceae bacterium]